MAKLGGFYFLERYKPISTRTAPAICMSVMISDRRIHAVAMAIRVMRYSYIDVRALPIWLTPVYHIV